jgi:hypothetical protein
MKSPDEMRKYLGMMRNPNKPRPKTQKNEEKKPKNMSMRDMLGKMRNLNESFGAIETTPIDQKQQEEKMFGYFEDDNLVFDFQKLDVKDNSVIYASTPPNTIIFNIQLLKIEN